MSANMTLTVSEARQRPGTVYVVIKRGVVSVAAALGVSMPSSAPLPTALGELKHISCHSLRKTETATLRCHCGESRTATFSPGPGLRGRERWSGRQAGLQWQRCPARALPAAGGPAGRHGEASAVALPPWGGWGAQERAWPRKSPSPGARLLPRRRVQQLILCRSVVPLLSALRGCLVCNLGFLFSQTLHADGSVFVQQPQRAGCPIFSHSFPPCPRWCCMCGEVQGCFYPGTVEPTPSRGKTPLRQRFPLKPRVDTGPLGPGPPPQALGRGTPQLFLHSGCWRRGSPPPTNQECCRWSGCHRGSASLLFKMPPMNAECPLFLASCSLSVRWFCVH